MEDSIKKESYLLFKLNNETFALNVSVVLNILEMPTITEVPNTPVFMVGIMNLRGMVLPVIDTKVKFGMPPTTITPNTCVLVLELEINTKTIRLGILVDSVEEVLEISDTQIQESPSIGTKYNTDYIVGMVQQEIGFIMILDINNIFSDNTILSLTDQKEINDVA